MTTLHLEVNDSGGWRRVMSFHEDHRGAVRVSAGILFAFQDGTRLRARIIAPHTTAPLMTWTNADGWKEWRT